LSEIQSENQDQKGSWSMRNYKWSSKSTPHHCIFFNFPCNEKSAWRAKNLAEWGRLHKHSAQTQTQKHRQKTFTSPSSFLDSHAVCFVQFLRAICFGVHSIYLLFHSCFQKRSLTFFFLHFVFRCCFAYNFLANNFSLLSCASLWETVRQNRVEEKENYFFEFNFKNGIFSLNF
jgi:hypothetical protein